MTDWLIQADARPAPNKQIEYDSTAKKLSVNFQKSGGRRHKVTLYKHDCKNTVSGTELLSVGASVSDGKGTVSSQKVEYFSVPITADLNKLATSAFLNTDKTKVEFCIKVELLQSATDDRSVNFMEVQMKMTIDLTATIEQAIVNIKKGEIVVYEDDLAHTYKLDACQCSATTTVGDNNRCIKPSGTNSITAVTTSNKLTQSDILGICVSNQADQAERIKIVKILTLTMTQGTNTLDVIKDDGSTVNVLSEYVTADKKDHVHRAKTRITSEFFTVAAGETNPPTIKVTGTADIVFKTGGGRRLRENGRSLQSEEQPVEKEPVGKFSFDINLSPDSDGAPVDDVSAAIAQLLGVPLATAVAFAL